MTNKFDFSVVLMGIHIIVICLQCQLYHKKIDGF